MHEDSAKRPTPGLNDGPDAPNPPLVVPTEFSSRRLVSLQCLRGIAALMVVIHHVIHQSPGFLSIWPTEAWQAGVDLFFVISGFVMVYVTSKREQSATQFLAMRGARIVPVYWFFTLAAAALMFFVPQLARSNELTVKHVVLSMLFLPHKSGTTGDLSPLVKQGWTLNYEMFFYVLFALAMAISLRRRTLLAVGALITLSAIGHALRMADIRPGALTFYLDDIILEFALGMLIATAYLGGKLSLIRTPLAVALVGIGFVAMFALQTDDLSKRALVYGLPAAAIVIGALAFEEHVPLRLRLLPYIGDASYSIYLVHIFPIALLRAVWPLPMDGWFSLAAFMLTTFAVTIALGRLSYTLVEQPSLKLLRRWIERRVG